MEKLIIEIRKLRRNFIRYQDRLLAIKSDLRFRKLMLALKEGFDPAQPRDEDGKWSAGGDGSFDVAARGNDALCEAQCARDTFICNAIKLQSCWENAAQRYAACLSGRAIPKLRF